jgi:hypothetical protein
MIAEEGRRLAREGSYERALKSYQQALDTLADGEGLNSLRIKLHLNTSFCHLKLRNFEVRHRFEAADLCTNPLQFIVCQRSLQ